LPQEKAVSAALFLIKGLLTTMFVRLFVLLLSLISSSVMAQEIHESYAFSVLGEPKYDVDFNHFDYVNPAAPKGGSITLSAIGTFDNFNRYALRGNAGIRTGELYDALFATSDDEPGSYYPLIAEKARHPEDFAWAEISINPRARFHDGSPVTAKDVEYTFHKFMTEGVPQFHIYYKGVKVKAISRLTVRIELPKPSKDTMLSLFTLPVMPEKFWRHHNLGEPLSRPPLSSGPYRISAWRMGQYAIFSRVKDYWAADLPVNRGRWNFDTIRYDYYLDDNVAFEAFKAGAFDFREEPSPKNWATRYVGKNFNNHHIVREEQENSSAQNTRWLAFNVKRPIFADRRVREAITLAFDFEWMNKALFYGAYSRTNSYFQNTEYAARGTPQTDELTLLAPFKKSLPPEVYSQIYQPPVSRGNGFDRANLLKALALLKAAGWEIKGGKLVNAKTGKPFAFELLLASGANNQWALPFSHSLERLGIQVNVRQVDNSQLTNRLRSRDFDMMPTVYRAMTYPSSDLQILWDSAFIDSTWNTPGVQDPVVDKLISQIIAHQGNEQKLLPLGRALDRVLTWNFYMLPMWYMASDRLAYWDKFSHPQIRPRYSLGFDTWWYDINKAARLPAERR
jgi:microcin C transport system substrate-binding protein